MDRQGNIEAARILEELIEQPAHERAALIASRCGGNDEMRRRVEALLALLDPPAGMAGPDMGDERAGAAGAAGVAGGADTVPAEEGAGANGNGNGNGNAGAACVEETASNEAEVAGTMIGRYKLLQLIGEGGFGTVWMAEQESPIVRRVALKVIKLGMDTKQVIARFEAERQALAMMDHPNIAKVLDAGAAASGRPYFVMELVKGVPITQYCDENKLDTRQRLGLFISVCNAVQHAHQKGIIHRDIKPSNVLVSMHDGKPVPKVIDFGIAKATQGRLTEKTLFTEFKHFVGTPEYMSPEQADMSGLDVDTRTDVYALGVLLYELLTGTTPFDPKELRSKAYGEIQRIIREVDPPRPSTRVWTLDEKELSTVASRRGTEPKRLGRLIRGELDWIAMKCLEKDRTRRYETANGLAVDVGRYLRDEPVAARRSGRAYRIAKFVRKHRVMALAGASVLGALVLGFVGTSVGMWRATNWARRTEVAEKTAQREKQEAIAQANRAVAAEQEAHRQRAVAEREFRRAVAVGDFMSGMLASARVDVPGGGKDVKVADLLDRAAAEIHVKFKDQPEAEINARATLGEAYLSLGMPELAHEHFGLGYRLAAAAKGEDSPQALFLATRMINAIIERGRPVSEPFAQTVYQHAKEKLGPRDDTTWRAATSLGRVLNGMQRFPQAEKTLREVIVNPGEAPGGTVSQAAAAEAYRALASAVNRQNRRIEAEALQHKALDFSRGAEGGSADPTQVWGESRFLAHLLESNDKLERSREIFAKVIDQMKHSPGLSHRLTQETIDHYARLLTRMGLYEELVQWRRLQLEQMPPRSAGTVGRLASLAEALALHGETDQSARERARETYAQTFALMRQLKAQVRVEDYREVALNAGLGPHLRFKSGEVRGQVWCVVRNLLHLYPSRIAELDEARWDLLKFSLTPVVGAGGSEVAGNMAALRALATPADGIYRLAVEVPMKEGEPLRGEGWLLFADWKVELYMTPFGPERDDKSWKALIAQSPLETRSEGTLALATVLTPRPGPLGRTARFGAVATASVRLPKGKYRIWTHVDDGLRVKVDDKDVVTPWSMLTAAGTDIDLEEGEHRLRVEYFQAEGPYQLWLNMEPVR